MPGVSFARTSRNADWIVGLKLGFGTAQREGEAPSEPWRGSGGASPSRLNRRLDRRRPMSGVSFARTSRNADWIVGLKLGFGTAQREGEAPSELWRGSGGASPSRLYRRRPMPGVSFARTSRNADCQAGLKLGFGTGVPLEG